jgi:hypothetical protein
MDNVDNIEVLYNFLCEHESDAQLHMPVFKAYAKKWNHITEMGVRTGRSTVGFLSGKPKKMISYDISELIDVEQFKRIASQNGTDFIFIKENVLNVIIEETDLLFIDTDHTYTQLMQEFNLHSNKVRKYILIHDIVGFGDGDDGLNRAINEFLENHPHWILEEVYLDKDGLAVLRNKNIDGNEYTKLWDLIDD